jgi:ABC-type spermidine/putrescine transport system permease subunit II
VEIFYALDNDFEPTITAIATLVVIGSLIILYLIQRLVGMEVLLRGGGSG